LGKANGLGRFPRVLGNRTGKNGNFGAVILTIVVSILTLLFDLSAIASIGSAVALVIVMMVGIAHLKLINETGAKRSLWPLLIWTHPKLLTVPLSRRLRPRVDDPSGHYDFGPMCIGPADC